MFFCGFLASHGIIKGFYFFERDALWITHNLSIFRKDRLGPGRRHGPATAHGPGFRRRQLAGFYGHHGRLCSGGLGFPALWPRADEKLTNARRHCHHRPGLALGNFFGDAALLPRRLPELFRRPVREHFRLYRDRSDGHPRPGGPATELLFWRSLTHWLGGLGIVVIFIALLPEAGQSTVYMYNAESTGPTRERSCPGSTT